MSTEWERAWSDLWKGLHERGDTLSDQGEGLEVTVSGHTGGGRVQLQNPSLTEGPEHS